MPLFPIAQAMGHKDTRMLERVYGRQTPEQQSAIMARAMGLPPPHPSPLPRPVPGGETQSASPGCTERQRSPADFAVHRASDVRARMKCLGAESNHRHGDFQAGFGSGQGRGIPMEGGGRDGAM